jgi:hypothetical protein
LASSRIHFCELLPRRHGQEENGPVSSYSSAPSNIAAAVISTRLTEWGFAPEVVEAMRTAYRMACDTPSCVTALTNERPWSPRRSSNLHKLGRPTRDDFARALFGGSLIRPPRGAAAGVAAGAAASAGDPLAQPSAKAARGGILSYLSGDLGLFSRQD